MSSAIRKPVLISGAGLAPLLFAQGLRRANIPFVIYERDASLSFRAQGYRLRLSTEGLDTIESVLSPEDWQRFWDSTGKTGGGGFEALNAVTGDQIKRDGNGPPKPADHLRQGDKVQWSHQITGYELTSHGVTALFADGSKSVEGDMLVGGDGIHSKIATQVSLGKSKTYDTGARGIHGQAPTTASKGLGEGVWRMVDETKGDGRRVFVITNVRPDDMDDASIHFGWTMGAQPGVIEAPNNDYAIIGKPAADIAKKLTADWHPRSKPLFEQMNENEAAFWKITCSTPSGVPVWPNEPRVTVIGDAAHSMTPAGGLGANTAVRDSALLSRLIVEKGGFADGITAAYEEQMRVYASEAVANSYGMATAQFGITINEDSSPTV